MSGQRLSQRRGKAEPDGPYEGVPGHLTHGLVHWVNSVIDAGPGGYFGNEQLIRELAIFMRGNVSPSWDAADVAQALIATASRDDDFFLDLVDGLLQLHGLESAGKRLSRLLATAGSVWTVGHDFGSLVRAVSDESQATYVAAVSTEDEATTELREAWSNAFGRNGDPSDAWGHAIKALEDLLIPIVVPKQDKPNLGHVVGQLRRQSERWKLVLPGKSRDHDVAPLVGMLDLVWPDHDRHGGTADKRTPSEQEARAVVTLTATIVQWHRDGWVVETR